MNFLKKSHSNVGQNDTTVKTSHKHDVNLQKNSTLYFQVGLILTLLAVYGMFEMQFQSKTYTPEPIALVQEPPLIYVNYIPEPVVEPVLEKKVQSKSKELLAVKLTLIDDNSGRNDNALEDVIVELPIDPTLTPGDIPDVVDLDDDVPVHFIAVEQVPIYPGCEGLDTNAERRACMSAKISKLINRKFDADLASDLGLSGRQNIYVQFKIDKIGNVVDIKAKAPHYRLQREAVRTVSNIPQMIPGKQRERNVEVIYMLPIRLQVQ
ncbi:MAG: energy transducer TonB [Flavobacteriaceae bacterium]|nr:energy transducer TonB [Flavobacteriaceae bacterium]